MSGRRWAMRPAPRSPGSHRLHAAHAVAPETGGAVWTDGSSRRLRPPPVDASWGPGACAGAGGCAPPPGQALPSARGRASPRRCGTANPLACAHNVGCR